MQYQTKDITIEFSSKTVSEPIAIFRNSPKGKKEIIGHVYQSWNEETDALTYQCVGIDGEAIGSPTNDWTEAEDAFERFARKYPPASLLDKQLEEMIDRYTQRTNQVARLRKDKERGIKNTIKR